MVLDPVMAESLADGVLLPAALPPPDFCGRLQMPPLKILNYGNSQKS